MDWKIPVWILGAWSLGLLTGWLVRGLPAARARARERRAVTIRAREAVEEAWRQVLDERRRAVAVPMRTKGGWTTARVDPPDCPTTEEVSRHLAARFKAPMTVVIHPRTLAMLEGNGAAGAGPKPGGEAR